MTFSIGRAGLDIALAEPMSVERATYHGRTLTQGGQVAFKGIAQPAVVADAARLRDQLVGLVQNMDEMAVPIVSAQDPTLTGYYAVKGVKITSDPLLIAQGIVGWEVGVDPIPGFNQPYIESVVRGSLLTNAVGGLTSDYAPLQMAPPGSVDYFLTGGGTATNARVGSDGTLVGNLSGAINAIVTFAATPANYYKGSCVIRQGSTLAAIVGRNIQTDTVGNWEMDNSLCKVAPNYAAGGFDITQWDPVSGTWHVTKTYKLFGGGSSTTALTGQNSVTVLRNSPELCVLRLSLVFAITGRQILDISLRRGDRLARFYLRADDNSSKWRIARSVTDAATAITYGAVTAGGLAGSVADAASQKYVMVSYQAATTSDTTNGKLTLSSAGTTFDFGIGACVDAGFGEQTSDLAKQYLAAQTESQRVVAR